MGRRETAFRRQLLTDASTSGSFTSRRLRISAPSLAGVRPPVGPSASDELAPQTKFAGRTAFAEFVSPALVDVAKPDVVAPSRLVAFSSLYHMRRIQGPGVPRTEQTFH